MMCLNRICHWKFHVIVIASIIALAGVNHYFTQTDFEQKALFVNISLILSIVATIAILIMIIKHYQGDRALKHSFMFLMFSYIAYLFGELVWFVYETIFGLYPYPSIADVGFLFYFIMSVVFLISIIRRFVSLTIHDIAYAVLVMGIITTTYLFISIGEDSDHFDIMFGLPFVLSSSAMFGFSLIALYKFRKSRVNFVWIILFSSMLVTTIADIWYYTAENLGQYTYEHIMNTMWIVSDALLVYSLLLYRKVL